MMLIRREEGSKECQGSTQKTSKRHKVPIQTPIGCFPSGPALRREERRDATNHTDIPEASQIRGGFFQGTRITVGLLMQTILLSFYRRLRSHCCNIVCACIVINSMSCVSHESLPFPKPCSADCTTVTLKKSVLGAIKNTQHTQQPMIVKHLQISPLGTKPRGKRSCKITICTCMQMLKLLIHMHESVKTWVHVHAGKQNLNPQ